MKHIAIAVVITVQMVLCLTAKSQQKAPDFIPPADTLTKLKIKSEPKFYVNIHGGYAVALGSTFKFYPDDVRSINMKMIDNNVVSKEVTYGNPKRGLGEGFRIGAGFSYVLNDLINVGLDIDYFKSTITKIRDSTFNQKLSSGPISSKTYTEQFTISYDATLITFSPNITFKAISRPKWFLYNKIGAILNFRPNSIEHDTRTSNTRMDWQGFVKDSAAYSDTRYEWVIKNPSFGFSGGLGIQYKITERIRVFSEVQFSHVVFVVSRRKTTNYNVDGKEMISSLTVSEREIDFEKNFQTDGWIADPNKPDKAVTQRIPITYVGMQAGLVYRF